MTLIFVQKVAGGDLETFTSTISVEESENSRSYSYKSKIKPLEIENRAVGAQNEMFEKIPICSKDAEAHLETFFCLQKLLQINTQEVTFHFVIFYVMYALTAAKAILRRKKASLTTK